MRKGVKNAGDLLKVGTMGTAPPEALPIRVTRGVGNAESRKHEKSCATEKYRGPFEKRGSSPEYH